MICIMVQLMSLSSLASLKSRMVLPFWCWLIQIVLEKRPLNRSSRVKVNIAYKRQVVPLNLDNGFAANDEMWHVHCEIPADGNRLCPLSICVLYHKLQIKKKVVQPKSRVY